MRRFWAPLLMLFISTLPLAPALAADEAGNLPSSIETGAIALTNAALANDRGSLADRYRLLAEQVNRLHSLLDRGNFDERRAREVAMAYSWLRLVKVNINHDSLLGTAIAANQLSAEMIRFQHDGSEKNWQAHWLGYLGRELTLLAMESAKDNADLLDSRRSDAMMTWQRMRQAVIRDFRNKPLVEEGDKLIAKIDSERSREQTIALGRQLAAFMQKVIDTAR